MPRPNKPRIMGNERALARRLRWEREARGWTYDGLAARMTAVGCPIQGSALFKVEKNDPPRRVTVDELVALSRVLKLSVPDLLTPLEVLLHKEIEKVAIEENEAERRLGDAIAAAFGARVARLNLRRKAADEQNDALAAAVDAWEEDRQRQVQERYPDRGVLVDEALHALENMRASIGGLAQREQDKMTALFYAFVAVDSALNEAASAYVTGEKD